MSQFTEYLKLLPKAIPNAGEIIKSIITEIQFRNNNLPEEAKAEIVRRRVICEGCPFMSRNAQTSPEYTSLTGKPYTTKRKENHCSFCGCELKMRTAALEKECGISAWNEEHLDNILPLKWTKFERNGK